MPPLGPSAGRRRRVTSWPGPGRPSGWRTVMPARTTMASCASSSAALTCCAKPNTPSRLAMRPSGRASSTCSSVPSPSADAGTISRTAPWPSIGPISAGFWRRRLRQRLGASPSAPSSAAGPISSCSSRDGMCRPQTTAAGAPSGLPSSSARSQTASARGGEPDATPQPSPSSRLDASTAHQPSRPSPTPSNPRPAPSHPDRHLSSHHRSGHRRHKPNIMLNMH